MTTDLHDRMAAHVASGLVPGLVTLVAHGDDAEVDVIGVSSVATGEPMRRDAIFRIASLSKPITAATAMSLVDDGTLTLDQPIDSLVPELARPRVLRSIDAELDDTVPADRSITLEDLLTFRMGVGIIMAMPGTHPIQRAEADLVLRSIGGPPWPPVDYDPDGWIGALGTLPLAYQPGTRWLYNTSAQVLGVLIARAADAPLERVVAERILDPLGMADTGFWVPPDRIDRLTTYYSPTAVDQLVVRDDPASSWWSTPPRFPDASGWMVSTIDDYWAFVSMLRHRGRHGGRTILTDRAVEAMTTDHLTAEQRARNTFILPSDAGWGYCMEVPAGDGVHRPFPRAIGWDGGSGTSWRTDPASDVTGIVLTQVELRSPELTGVLADFWDSVNDLTN